jgi:Tfp pilus assembly protein PilN
LAWLPEEKTTLNKMIKINLLPPESIKKEDRKEIFAIACILVAVCVALGGVQYTVKLASFVKLKQRSEKTRQELGKYENIVKQVESLQATKNVLESKKNVISTLMTRRLVYARFMEAVVNILPGSVWFRNLTTKYDGVDKLACTLSAEATDNYAIADVITAMAASTTFTGVELGAINSRSGQKQSSTFTLTFSYQEKKKNG